MVTHAGVRSYVNVDRYDLISGDHESTTFTRFRREGSDLVLNVDDSINDVMTRIEIAIRTSR
ncbi:hypothetical protein [Aureimonas sp. AU22]|uniref:hypothetical protein n=1 Tax=Aureimonas sp. AU22 TaxID=1638162 RepID=UPI0012E33343|nr:hypothetical protein [Aureimonas sp. AU22]